MIRSMAAEATEVSTKVLVDTKRTPGLARRPTWSDALKRRIVDETPEVGASVSIVARRRDVKANKLFQW
jgi:transposase